MSLESLNCQNCGSPMDYVPGMPVVTCTHCGSHWQMQGSDQLTPVQGPDGILFYAWIPQGWSCTTERDERWISTKEYVTFDLMASSNQASLWFFPKAYFKEGNSKTYGLNPLTFQNAHQFLPLEQYVPQRLRETFPTAENIQFELVSQEPFASLGQRFMVEAANHIKNPGMYPGMFRFSFQMNGRTFYGFFGTVLVRRQEAVQQPEKPKAKMDFNFFMRGGLVGAKMRGEEVPFMPNTNFFKGHWARGMDVILLTPDQRLSLYQDIFTAFVCNVNYGPGYAAAQQRERQLVNQINMQGAMQRQQIQINASKRLSNTLSQRSNMVMDSWNQRQAAQTRMSNNFSEAIRGVNSYTTTGGQKVEASVRYDHVYQNGSDFIASDTNLNLGPDWSELNRKK